MSFLLERLSSLVIYLIDNYGQAGVFLSMVLESACIPLPSEIILPLAGYLVYKGEFIFWKIALLASLANVLGGYLLYLTGKFCGRSFILRYGKVVFLDEGKLKKTESFFEKYGEFTVFFGRMLPVVRTFISLPAGIAGMNPGKVILYTFLGSFPWCVFLIWTGKQLGENWKNIETFFQRFHWVLGGAAAVLLLSLTSSYLLKVFRKK